MTMLLLRGFFAAILSLCFSWSVLSRYDGEIGAEAQADGQRRFTPYVPGELLPMLLLTLLVLAGVTMGFFKAAELTLSTCFGIFLHISLYDALLLPLMPLLRRKISARACAMLWMIPNYLYLTQHSAMAVERPLWVIAVPDRALAFAFALWACGFCAVMGYHLFSHLRFRRQILRRARPLTDPGALAIWQEQLTDLGIKKPKCRVVISPDVRAPMSVGYFARAMRVVLPEKVYSAQQLRWIFRHELIHIAREDTHAKFFLVFCTAMCWFNPLMYAAKENCAQDLELSCDESVLLAADEQERRAYAQLILDAAADARGFTTCLSARAQGMRYRLKHIVSPQKRHSGALAVGLVFFLLCMSCGYTALSYGTQYGETAIYQGDDPASWQLRHAVYAQDPYQLYYEAADPKALGDFLAALEVSKLTGSYAFEDASRKLTLLFDTSRGVTGLTITDEQIKITPLYGETRPESTTYYIPGGVNWAQLDSLLSARRPAMTVLVYDEGQEHQGDTLTGSLWSLSETKNGQMVQTFSRPAGETPSGMFGHKAERAALSFSHRLLSEVRITIVPQNGGREETILLDDFNADNTFALAPYHARYFVRAQLRGADDAQLEAEFCFDFDPTYGN